MPIIVTGQLHCFQLLLGENENNLPQMDWRVGWVKKREVNWSCCNSQYSIISNCRENIYVCISSCDLFSLNWNSYHQLAKFAFHGKPQRLTDSNEFRVNMTHASVWYTATRHIIMITQKVNYVIQRTPHGCSTACSLVVYCSSLFVLCVRILWKRAKIRAHAFWVPAWAD